MRRIARYSIAIFAVLSLIIASISPLVRTAAAPVFGPPPDSQPNPLVAPRTAVSGEAESRPPPAQAQRPGTPLSDAPATPVSGDQPPKANTPQLETTDPILRQQILDYLDSQPGRYGVAVEDLATHHVTLIDADQTFESASTYKLLVMYCVYQQLSTGKLSLDTSIAITDTDAVEDEPDSGLYVGDTVTVGYALRSMIEISSNAAAYALARTVGGWDRVVTAAEELGMMGTTRDETNGFVTTPNDMLTFLLALTQLKLVSPEASDSMLLLLARQPNNDRIPAELPDGVLVAHKTGELPEVRNDVGIVFAPGGRYVICVFGAGDKGTEADMSIAIAHVSRLAYDRYAQAPSGIQGSADQPTPR
jgi:beta-lactamase class A